MSYEQPTLLDIKGREIKEFDLLKVFHFTGSRRKKYYMYKWVKRVDGYLRAFHLDHNTDKSKMNSYLLTPSAVENSEIIQGFGPTGGDCYEDRIK